MSSLELVISITIIGITITLLYIIFSYRNTRNSQKSLEVRIQEAEQALIEDIRAVGVVELRETQAGRELLSLLNEVIVDQIDEVVSHANSDPYPENQVKTPSNSTSQSQLVPGKQQEPSSKSGRTSALIIGIDQYKSARLPSLQLAVQDAKVLAMRLERDFGVGVQLLTNEQASRANILRTFYDLIDSANETDIIIFGFFGHIRQDISSIAKKIYLLPYDAELEQVEVEGISNMQLNEILSKSRATRTVLMFDTTSPNTILGLSDDSNGIYTSDLDYQELFRWNDNVIVTSRDRVVEHLRV